jgi:hypothetical protein
MAGFFQYILIGAMSLIIGQGSDSGNLNGIPGKNLQKINLPISESLPWLGAAYRPQLSALKELIIHANEFGLKADKLQLPARTDSNTFNKKATEISQYIFCTLAYGSKSPSFGYQALTATADSGKIQQLFKAYFFSNRLQAFADSLNKNVEPLIRQLAWYDTISSQKNFKEIPVSPVSTGMSNSVLVTRLYQLGFLPTAKTINPALIHKAILDAQNSFDLLADGVIRSTFREQLNLPIKIRIAQCLQAMNDLRWLRQLSGQNKMIVVNIPAAFMQLYEGDSMSLSMRLVVGKRSTPTPTFTSIINEVVLYPYWHVPHSIASKELLPLIKLSRSFLDKGGYQVMNKAGKIMDPTKINWSVLSASNFPYLIRQSTGCDNALGLLKLNFDSPFGVYLHDTPYKNAFSLHRRYFSHGCMRMEKPFELSRIILNENTIAIDTISQKGCLTNQAPVVVKAISKIPLIVWYNPASIGVDGQLKFYEDVYQKFK